MPYRIIGPKSDPHSGSFSRLFDALRRHPGGDYPVVSDLFLSNLAPALWNAADELGIDAYGLIAQAGKETNWGRFVYGDGLTPTPVQPWFCNTANLKIRYQNQWYVYTGRLTSDIIEMRHEDPTAGDKPLSYQMFPSWPMGARAHAQRIYVHAGGRVPITADVVDPGWWALSEQQSKGDSPIVQTWFELGNGVFNESAHYGRSIETIMDRFKEGSGR